MSNFVLEDCFFAPRIERNMQSTVPAVWAACEKTGRFKAFDLNWKEGDPGKPHIYWDSDVAKWIEGVAYVIQNATVPEWEKLVDEMIDNIAENQRADGYFNSYFLSVEPNPPVRAPVALSLSTTKYFWKTT